ncbi:hypothetical protein ACH5RR_016124 [Cinchona calisaya]|uniref:Calcineurin-like phosphoesterase domain-containing protein n=1 Tax=Cinchona calisaya TaxID=153742 RepID=A0ABD2ZYH1_9GENT
MNAKAIEKRRRKEEMGSHAIRNLMILLFLFFVILVPCCSSSSSSIIQVKSGPSDVVWVVQLSDLHFSVHHPERAQDFKSVVGPTLSMINPSLVLITGDLTDGKSKDLLIMKQDKEEWIEYQNVMEDVVKRSGLNKSIFYDLRGNHDNFGVSSIGSPYDFFSTYSLNGQLRRSGQVNSIVIQTGERKLLFVGIDSTMSSGLQGPTNLFGHPTDQLLNQLSSALTQWDSQSAEPITKISFGHFPLSFSAASSSGKTLKDVLLKHSLSAYLCGHLHTKFGGNLKRHHESAGHLLYSHKLIQLDANRIHSDDKRNCSDGVKALEEFWEWEMGDWRKSRAMRILAIDRGYISFIDTDFKLGPKKTIILPTFPLDSRFMEASYYKHKCQSMDSSLYNNIRALVFSASPIVSVMARVYDSSPGKLVVVLETSLRKLETTSSRGDLYFAPWNFRAFEDPSPERFLLQIETTDIMGRSTLSELRPFSINGLHAKLLWSWKEFLVMGCQWDALYYLIFWSFYFFILSAILIPKILLSLSRKQYTYRHYISNKGFIRCMAWIFTELYNVSMVWGCLVGYLFYLILCPWFSGKVFTDSKERGYMTYRGWVLKPNEKGELEFLGFPDIMVVVLPHLFFVVLPAIVVIGALAAERGTYHDYLLSLSGKKEDDNQSEIKGSGPAGHGRNNRSKFLLSDRWVRNVILVVSLAIWWKHFQSCRALMKAYELHPIIHFPIYSLSIPLMLIYTIYKTGRI